ncbi:hypothetical protein QVD17_33023 [Tagetes erecta]|uniref:Uncharacterized protein n=1 Tax=Tagetes erecta TaxID=13708 RepID=A0AAD8JYC4_TARER|nr:hypothetical protein QVD17_33023 [Tagetes erecta]
MAIMENLEFYLNTSNGPCDCTARYLGGLQVLLSFDDEVEAAKYLGRTEKGWKSIFSSLETWEKSNTNYQRIVWTNIYGIPPHLFNGKLCESIAKDYGKIAQDSKASLSSGNLSYGRVAITTDSLEKIDKIIRVNHAGINFSCRIQEDATPWIPKFLRKDDGQKKSSSTGSDSGMTPGYNPPENAPTKPLATIYDTEFEESMASRSEELDRLDFNAARDIFSVFMITQSDWDSHSWEQHVENSLHNEGIENPVMGQDSYAKSTEVHLPVAGNQGYHPPGPSNPLMDLNTHVECLNETVGSDPFGLGPIIEQVMANGPDSKDASEDSGLSARNHLPTRDSTKRAMRRKKNILKIPDLNEELCCFSNLKLSRRLMCRQRNQFKKKGKVVKSFSTGVEPDEGSCSNAQSSSQIPLNSGLPDLCHSASPELQNPTAVSCEGMGESETMVISNDSGDPHPHENASMEEQQLRIRQVNEEVNNTILINAMVQINLEGHREELKKAIMNEGVIDGNQ